MPNVAPSAELTSAPFIAEHIRHPELGSSRFIPQTRLIIEIAALRRGLLASLTDESVRTLLAVLSFLTPNGRAEPTAHQIADVLGISVGRARERLLRLSSMRFADEPILIVRQTESGLEMFAVSPCVLTSRDEDLQEEQNETAVIASHRDAVIGHSRGAHARPRAEVEQMVLQQLGLPEPEVFDDSREGALRKRLSGIGMLRETAESLIADFGVDAVERQMNWLPYRHAKDSARYLAAAVRGRYGEPIEYWQRKEVKDAGGQLPGGEVAAVPLIDEDASVSLPLPDGI